MTPAQRVITVDEFRGLVKAGAKASMPGARSKYGAIRMRYLGHGFDSKSELAFHMHLQILQRLGQVAWWTRQIPFHLPDTKDAGGSRGTIYRADFGVAMAPGGPWCGQFRIVDIKGMHTRASTVKRAWVQSYFGVHVEVVPGKSNGGYEWGTAADHTPPPLGPRQ